MILYFDLGFGINRKTPGLCQTEGNSSQIKHTN
jgi:hypothetical protein